MRIAYLTQPYPPMISGASILAAELAEDMARRGHKILVIAASERGDAYAHVKDNLTISRLKSIANPLRVGQRIVPIARRSVLENLREFKPDVIHVHEPFQMGAHGLEYAKRFRIPTILTTHQLPWFIASYLPNLPFVKYIAEKTLWLYSDRLVNRFTSVISPTRTVTRIIRSNTGVIPRTIPYGINLETFHLHGNEQEKKAVRTRYGLPLNIPVIIHVGRLDVDKSVHRVVLASAQAMQNNDAHLLVVGDGKQREYLMNLCESLGIGSRSHFPGFIFGKEELSQIYRASDVFITASEIETQGIVLLEAAACGLPIIAVDAAGTPETVHHGENGLLCEPGNIDNLGRSLGWLLGNADISRAMGIKSRTIAERFDADLLFQKHEKLYKKLVKCSQMEANSIARCLPSSPRIGQTHPRFIEPLSLYLGTNPAPPPDNERAADKVDDERPRQHRTPKRR